jgi:hypothetical protein
MNQHTVINTQGTEEIPVVYTDKSVGDTENKEEPFI